ncbi:MAG: BrnT family toxin [Hyphomicrobiales bacterium]|nr:MAG: BrnT family toxin [Hyphomicrobiales bacterium]
MYFEWDEHKRLRNLEIHLIDFEDAARVFDAPYLKMRSDRGEETRFVAIGVLKGIEIAVVYTERQEACRIISARRARVNERTEYHEALKGSASERPD